MLKWIGKYKKDIIIISFVILFMAAMVIATYQSLKLFSEGAKNQVNMVIPLKSLNIAEAGGDILIAEGADTLAAVWNDTDGFAYETFIKATGELKSRGRLSGGSLIRLKVDGGIIYAVTSSYLYKLDGEAAVAAEFMVPKNAGDGAMIDAYYSDTGGILLAYCGGGGLYVSGLEGEKPLSAPDIYSCTFENPRFASAGSRIVCDIYTDSKNGFSITDVNTGDTKLFYPNDLSETAAEITGIGLEGGNKISVESADGSNNVLVTEIDVKTMEITGTRSLAEFSEGTIVQFGGAMVETSFLPKESETGIDDNNDGVTDIVNGLNFAVTNTLSNLRYTNYAWIESASEPYTILSGISGGIIVTAKINNGYGIYYVPIVFN